MMFKMAFNFFTELNKLIKKLDKRCKKALKNGSFLKARIEGTPSALPPPTGPQWALKPPTSPEPEEDITV
jgi:hypothetical protein